MSLVAVWSVAIACGTGDDPASVSLEPPPTAQSPVEPSSGQAHARQVRLARPSLDAFDFEQRPQPPLLLDQEDCAA